MIIFLQIKIFFHSCIANICQQNSKNKRLQFILSRSDTCKDFLQLFHNLNYFLISVIKIFVICLNNWSVQSRLKFLPVLVLPFLVLSLITVAVAVAIDTAETYTFTITYILFLFHRLQIIMYDNSIQKVS